MNEPTVNDTHWRAPAEPAPYRNVDYRTDPTATEPVEAERVSPSGGWFLAVCGKALWRQGSGSGNSARALSDP